MHDDADSAQTGSAFQPPQRVSSSARVCSVKASTNSRGCGFGFLDTDVRARDIVARSLRRRGWSIDFAIVNPDAHKITKKLTAFLALDSFRITRRFPTFAESFGSPLIFRIRCTNPAT